MLLQRKNNPRVPALIVMLVLVILTGASLKFVTSTRAYAITSTANVIVTNPYTPPNCTWYVWQRLHDEGIDMQGVGYANAWVTLVSNPNEFYSEQTHQYLSQQQVQITPNLTSAIAKGDFIVLPVAGKYAHPYHVAFIDGVGPNGSLQLSDQNSGIFTGDGYQPYSSAPYTHHHTWNWSDIQTDEHGEGRLVHFSTGNTSAQVGHTLPQVGATHSPVIIENGNGQEEIFMVGQNSQLYHQWQNSDGSWSGWFSLGGSWPRDPAVDRDRNGILEVFLVGNTGPNGATLFHAWQTSAGSNNWTGWVPMSGNWPSETPAVTYNLAGGQEVFMRGLDSHLYHSWLSSSGWSEWYSLGGNWSRDPVATKNANGRMEIFLVGLDNQLYHIWQNPNTGWGSWTSLGGSWPNNPAVNLNQNGVMEIFIIGNTGSNGAGLFHARQTSPGSTSWTGWNIMSGNWPGGVRTVAQNMAGSLEVFMLGLNNYHLYHAWQTSPGANSWTSWYDFGASWSRYPVVFKRSDGRMDVFLVGLNKVLYHIAQNFDSGWISPTSLGGNWP